jgi:starch phosphorylase
MSNSTHMTYPTQMDESDVLVQLALDLRWSWNHSSDELWRQLEPELWERTQNPWVVLQSASPTKRREVAADPAMQKLMKVLVQQQTDLGAPAWLQKKYPDSPLKSVAYFSMEYMLSESLPIYSGGLGNVAGDQLKAASDLGVPVIGIGLLYQQGYFRQEIDAEGKQLALYPYNDPGQLPISPVRDASGEWLRLLIDLPGSPLWIRVWQVRVGRNKLYLLDTNDPANIPADRGITSELYGGGPELRLRQELVLGIAGWRTLRALELNPEICHLNEGHAAFAILERARSWMADHQKSFDIALAATRAGNLFTTHTAVAAGFDRFSPELMARYLRAYAAHDLAIPFENLLALGRQDPSDEREHFNMAFLALRGSGSVNAVSRLHGEVSRTLFQPLFPRWPQSEVPVGYVTNGVHTPSWDSAESDDLWTAASGNDRWREDQSGAEKGLRRVSDEDLWKMRRGGRTALVEDIRKRVSRQLAGQGSSAEEVAAAGHLFDPGIMTIGFARRFATYKRPNLLLHDPERLVRLLTNSECPVQLVIAGKAHPQDLPGQAMIEEWFHFLRRPEVRPHVVFLHDYDMRMAETLVQGVDLWINTPRRPWEACGTSGMKVLVNGGLNVSELDGWWVEAYSPEVGWAIGDGKEHGDDPAWDAAEEEALYSLLEQEIIPAFYKRDERGVSCPWLAKMRESMARLTPAFSANRAVRQYTEEHYLPGARAYRERSANDGAQAVELRKWAQQVQQHWAGVRFGELKRESNEGQATIAVEVYLNGLDPNMVTVELYAEGLAGNQPARQEMTRGQLVAGSADGYVYSAPVSTDRAVSDYTPRVVPCKMGLSVPLEAGQILWQH